MTDRDRFILYNEKKLEALKDEMTPYMAMANHTIKIPAILNL